MCVFSTSETDVVFGEATAHSRSHVWSKLLVPRHGVGGSLAGGAYIASCAMCANRGATDSSPFSFLVGERLALTRESVSRQTPLPAGPFLRQGRLRPALQSGRPSADGLCARTMCGPSGGSLADQQRRCKRRPYEKQGHAMACPYDLPGAANQPHRPACYSLSRKRSKSSRANPASRSNATRVPLAMSRL